MGRLLKGGGAAMAAALAMIGTWEGVRTVAYRDPVGIPTVCFGETRGVQMGDSYTLDECREMLAGRAQEFDRDVSRCLRHPDAIPDETYAAFVSLAYNIGGAAFCTSTVSRRANAGDLNGACDAITMWVYAGGKKLRGLERRREAERELCLEGVNVSVVPFGDVFSLPHETRQLAE